MCRMHRGLRQVNMKACIIILLRLKQVKSYTVISLKHFILISDEVCDGLLRCVQRSGTEVAPGGNDREYARDFCFLAIGLLGVVNYVGKCGYYGYLCGLCDGDCDNDSDYEPGLVCRQRSAFETV